MDIVRSMNHFRWSASGQSSLSLSSLLFLSTSRKQLLLCRSTACWLWVTERHVRAYTETSPHFSHADTRTHWRKVTYIKTSGQSSLDIHCHWICAGVGNPRAVHLRVGLLPCGYTSVSTGNSFSMIWGRTVEGDTTSYHCCHFTDNVRGGKKRDGELKTCRWPAAEGSADVPL